MQAPRRRQPGRIPWYMHTRPHCPLPPSSLPGNSKNFEKKGIIVSENLAAGCAMREDVLRVVVVVVVVVDDCWVSEEGVGGVIWTPHIRSSRKTFFFFFFWAARAHVLLFVVR